MRGREGVYLHQELDTLQEEEEEGEEEFRSSARVRVSESQYRRQLRFRNSQLRCNFTLLCCQ